MLTERQQQILNYIMAFRQEHGCSPSIPEMQRHFGIRSPNGIVGHLHALETKGFIRRGERGSRQIDVVEPLEDLRAPIVNIPVFGLIPAGTPVAVTEHQPEACISVDVDTLGFKPDGNCFAVKVRGESMRDAGILDGDTVIADASVTPRPNQIVVALIDGESTLKRLVHVKGKVFLKAENAEFPDLTPQDELQIQGVVRTVIRRM